MPEISPEEQEWTRVVTQQLLELRSRVLDIEHRRRMAPKPAGFVELPDDLIEALGDLSPSEAEGAVGDYLRASTEEREEILGFVRTGRELLRQLKLRHEEGVPTDADIARWLDGGEGEGVSRG